MARQRFIAAWLVAAMGTASALTGCGGEDPAPVFADDPTAGATPSASPDPEESEAPKRETPRQFIRRWNELERTMQVTGDTSEYRALSPECESCRRTADLIEGFYAAGGYVKWEGRTTKRIEHLGNHVYDMWLDTAPTEYKESSTGEVKRMDGGRSKLQIVLVRENGRFLVADLFRRPL